MRTVLPAPIAALVLIAGCTGPSAQNDSAGRDHAAPLGATVVRAAGPASSEAHAPAAGPRAAPAPDTVHLALSGDGLDFVTGQGRVRHLLFDSPAAQAIEAVTRVYGLPPERSRNAECGAGPLDIARWPVGLTLVLRDDRFVGWAASAESGGEGAHALATLAGVGPGSMRQALESAYAARVEASTLGQEFTAGGLSGVLDGAAPTARIDAMWAGTSCNFR